MKDEIKIGDVVRWKDNRGTLWLVTEVGDHGISVRNLFDKKPATLRRDRVARVEQLTVAKMFLLQAAGCKLTKEELDEVLK